MNNQRDTYPNKTILSGLVIMLLLLTNACDENPASEDGKDAPSETLTMVEGQLNGYDLGAQELYESEEFVDLIEGSIDEEGAFTVEFMEEQDIEDALKPLSEDSDGFVAMYCREEILEELSDDHQFVDVSKFNFTYGSDNNVGVIGYSSEAPNYNVYPPQSDHKGDYQVRWIFSTQEVTISENCGGSGSDTHEVDIEFSNGWNEVIFDLSESDTKRMYTGERPTEADWVLEK
jgi:hypothetical protein